MNQFKIKHSLIFDKFLQNVDKYIVEGIH